MCDVDADPSAPELLCCVHCGPATAKRIEDYVALIGRCGDDPLQQRERFLRRIAKSLGSSLIYSVDIGPHVAYSDCAGFGIERLLVSSSWDSSIFGPMDEPGCVPGVHLSMGVPP